MESIPGWSIGTLSNIQDRPHEPFLPSSAALTAVGPRWRTAAPAADEMQLPDEPPFTANHWRAASPVAPNEVEQQLATASDHLFSAAMQTIVQESITSAEPSKPRRGSLVPSWLRRLHRPKAFKNQGRRT